jgi:hypothetical protein
MPGTATRPHRFGQMCNLYYADLWIMPTIGPELSLAAVIAASESA